ncbi:hypothetical protein C1D09_003345 [Mesorhizobium intechi]|uniref:Uncharacterized protein n=1 Tax=Mesorhizobium intechi TaxID=537601 RepID=A0A8T9AVP7_9HYPH|nr:hypothetical protein [Mesorhizobium intechi]TSE13523.1 hypothetical protein C1D09_003345 [Mesorhizobium intechi]
MSGRKPLRKPKGIAARAKRIDAAAELAPGLGAPATVYALRAAAPAPAAPPPYTPSTSFQIGEDDNTSIPPDTHAAVGPKHVFATHNNDIAIYDRAGNLVSRTSLNSFWSGVGLTGHTFDPKVVYDRDTKRFYFVSMADAEEATSRVLIAVSDSADPTGIWRPYAIQVDPAAQGKVWMDYPSLGFCDDKITVSVNLFTLKSNAFAGATIYAFDKASFFNPAGKVAVQRFVLANMGATHAPAVTMSPKIQDQYIVETWSGNASGKGYLMVLRISGSVAAGAATLTRVGYASSTTIWDSFPPVPEIGPQLGTAAKLAVGDDRMQTVVLRDGKLFCCHTVMLPSGAPTVSAIQWWDIPIQTWVASVGRLTELEGGCLAHPSMAVNDRGDKVIGLSIFAPGIHPSGACYGISNGLGPVGPSIFAAGTATYEKRFGGAQNRWGDYSATMTDPENDRDFWTAQTHSEPWIAGWAEAGRWSTRIALVIAPP